MAGELKRRIDEAAAFVRARAPVRPEAGIILGTGLGDFAGALTLDAVVPYRDIPHFPVSTVESHAGELHLGRLAGRPVAIMKGRVHYYESSLEDTTSLVQAQDELRKLRREKAQADLRKNFEIQQGLTREARVRELTADAAQWQTTDPALALYLGWHAAQMGRPMPPGLEEVLSTSLENGPSYGVLRDHGVNALTWSPDGNTLYSSSSGSAIAVWDLSGTRGLTSSADIGAGDPRFGIGGAGLVAFSGATCTQIAPPSGS
jgi:hypothetical protein